MAAKNLADSPAVGAKKRKSCGLTTLVDGQPAAEPVATGA